MPENIGDKTVSSLFPETKGAFREGHWVRFGGRQELRMRLPTEYGKRDSDILLVTRLRLVTHIVRLCLTVSDVGWVAGQNGGPSPRAFPIISDLNQSTTGPPF